MDTRIICLGLLSEGELTGYEIKKLFETRFCHFFAAGFGSIYPALAGLADEGLVTVRDVAQEGRPDKRVYRITERGQDLLKRSLLAIKPRHKIRSEFLMLMYFAHLLPRELVLAHLDTMIARFRQSLETDLDLPEAEAAALTPGQRFDLGYGKTIVGAALAYCEGQRDELARALAADERQAAE